MFNAAKQGDLRPGVCATGTAPIGGRPLVMSLAVFRKTNELNVRGNVGGLPGAVYCSRWGGRIRRVTNDPSYAGVAGSARLLPGRRRAQAQARAAQAWLTRSVGSRGASVRAELSTRSGVFRRATASFIVRWALLVHVSEARRGDLRRRAATKPAGEGRRAGDGGRAVTRGGGDDKPVDPGIRPGGMMGPG